MTGRGLKGKAEVGIEQRAIYRWLGDLFQPIGFLIALPAPRVRLPGHPGAAYFVSGN